MVVGVAQLPSQTVDTNPTNMARTHVVHGSGLIFSGLLGGFGGFWTFMGAKPVTFARETPNSRISL